MYVQWRKIKQRRGRRNRWEGCIYTVESQKTSLGWHLRKGLREYGEEERAEKQPGANRRQKGAWRAHRQARGPPARVKDRVQQAAGGSSSQIIQARKHSKDSAFILQQMEGRPSEGSEGKN